MNKRILFCAAMLFCFLQTFSQAGTFDLSFGDRGVTHSNVLDVNYENESARAVVVQPDGKILVAGRTTLPGAILRYNTDGTLDNSFSQDGMAFIYKIVPVGMILQGDGKILLAGNNFSVARVLPNGTLDVSFGTNGIANTTFTADRQTSTCMALQSDGKIIMAGDAEISMNSNFAVARFNSDGTIDNSFDGDGRVITPFGTSTDKINAIAVQPDGKIVVTGFAGSGGPNEVAVGRYNNDGSLDNSFDGDGKQMTPVGTGGQGTAISIVSGKIVVASACYPDVAILKYNSDGTLDNTFDGDGKLMIPYDGHSFTLRSMLIGEAGKVVLGGFKHLVDNDYNFGLMRFNADGSPDDSFEGDGKLMTSFGPHYDIVYALALQTDGKMIAVGLCEIIAGSSDLAMARYNDDGSLDNSFSGDGKIELNFGTSYDAASSLALQTDGKILVGGTGEYRNENDFGLIRFNPDGSLDNSFGTGGKVATSFVAGKDDRITSMAIQSDGKIIVGGTTLSSNYFEFALARYHPNGTLDNSFDVDGKLINWNGYGNNRLNSIVIQSDGKILAGGSVQIGSTTDFLLVRYNTDGSLDNTFNNGGRVITALTAGSEQIIALALQMDGKIVAAGTSGGDFALVRYNTDGSLDNSFDSDGMVFTDINSSGDVVYAMALQADGKILLGGMATNDDNGRFALARYNTNGTLDNSFDGDGKVMTDINSLRDDITSIAIQSNGKIMVAGNTRTSSNNRFVLARYNPDGTPDNSFDSDGMIILNMKRGDYDNVPSIKLLANRIYISGSTETEGGPDFVLAAIQNDALESPLPLRLLEFSGKLVARDAVLSWKTDNEINAKEFVVERSTDGRNYNPVGSVNAVNATGINLYNYTDNGVTSLNAQVLYYRLQQKDLDGRQTYSRIIALTTDKSSIVLFYPNPVVNEANLAITLDRADRVQARIIDNQGRIVKQQQWSLLVGSTSLSIDVKSLAKGIYYLELKGNSINYNKQFIK